MRFLLKFGTFCIHLCQLSLFLTQATLWLFKLTSFYPNYLLILSSNFLKLTRPWQLTKFWFCCIVKWLMSSVSRSESWRVVQIRWHFWWKLSPISTIRTMSAMFLDQSPRFCLLLTILKTQLQFSESIFILFDAFINLVHSSLNHILKKFLKTKFDHLRTVLSHIIVLF